MTMVKRGLLISAFLGAIVISLYCGFVMGWSDGWDQGEVSAELRAGATVLTALVHLRKGDSAAIEFLDRRLAEISKNVKTNQHKLPSDRMEGAKNFFADDTDYRKTYAQVTDDGRTTK